MSGMGLSGTKTRPEGIEWSQLFSFAVGKAATSESWHNLSWTSLQLGMFSPNADDFHCNSITCRLSKSGRSKTSNGFGFPLRSFI
jgi:hypothetical protein